MTLFKRRKAPRISRSTSGRRFAMTYILVKDLTPAQYDNFKKYMDDIFRSAKGMDGIKTKDEKINGAEEYLEMEAR